MRIIISILIITLLAACMHTEVEPTVSRERQISQADEYFKLREYDNAIELYNELDQMRPLAIQDLYQLGRAYYYTEQFEKADAVFGRMQGKSPNSKVTYLWRARANAAIDSTAEKGLAFPYYKKLLEDPSMDLELRVNFKEAYNYLMYFYLQKKEYGKMKECIEKLLVIYADNPKEVEHLNFIKEMIERTELKK